MRPTLGQSWQTVQFCTNNYLQKCVDTEVFEQCYIKTLINLYLTGYDVYVTILNSLLKFVIY